MSTPKTYYRDGFVALKETDDVKEKVWWIWRPGDTWHSLEVHVRSQKAGWKAHVLTAINPVELEVTPTLMSAAAAYSSALTWIRKDWKKVVG